MKNKSMAKETNTPLLIREQRTFVARMYCKCEGEFIYDDSDIFTSLFSSILSKDEEPAYEHKCNKCGKVKKFQNRYPLKMSFEIWVGKTTEQIIEEVSAEFDKVIRDDYERAQEE